MRPWNIKPLCKVIIFNDFKAVVRARRLFLRWALKEASSSLASLKSLKSLVSQMPRWAQPNKSSVQIMSLSNFSGKCIRWKKIWRFIFRRSPSPFPGKQNGSFLSRTNFHLKAEMRRTFVRKIEDDEKKWKNSSLWRSWRQMTHNPLIGSILLPGNSA